MSRPSLDYVVCPLCGCEESRATIVAAPHRKEIGGVYNIVSCSSCSCMFLNPRLKPDSLSRCYQLLQSCSNSDTEKADAVAGPSSVKRWWRHYGGYQVADAVRSGPVLDLGCDKGILLQELKDRGFAVAGVEFSRDAVRECVARGFDVVEADLRSFSIEAGRYRTVILSHVLEHLSDPVQFLGRVAQRLRPDDNVVICVPHVKSPVRWLFGSHWHGWDPPFHLVHYEEATLRKACELAGLSVVAVGKRVIPDDFFRSLALASQKRHRRIILRICSVPIAVLLTVLGFGSYLLVTAKPASGR